MGFWFFMTIFNFLIPVSMVIFGRMLIKHPPKFINNNYGYCTPMSKKTQDTWDFAQICCGKLWWKTGWIMLPFSIIIMLPVIKRNIGAIGVLGTVVVTIESLIMLSTIFFVEKALKKNFDKDGNRINL